MESLERSFDYQGSKVRTVVIDGEPWFVGSDVCVVLEYANAPQALGKLDEDEKGIWSVDTPGGKQAMIVVSEAGLYSLVLRSRAPKAKPFRRWITHEVIPSIRKDGMYVAPALLNDPEHLLRVTTRLVEEHRARLVAEAKVEELAPKASFYDEVASSDDTQSIRDVAKILGTGQNRLFAWLRGNGILMSDNRPYQAYIDQGYFRVIEQTWQDRDGNVHLTSKTLVTGRGLPWIERRFHAERRGNLQ